MVAGVVGMAAGVDFLAGTRSFERRAASGMMHGWSYDYPLGTALFCGAATSGHDMGESGVVGAAHMSSGMRVSHQEGEADMCRYILFIFGARTAMLLAYTDKRLMIPHSKPILRLQNLGVLGLPLPGMQTNSRKFKYFNQSLRMRLRLYTEDYN